MKKRRTFQPYEIFTDKEIGPERLGDSPWPHRSSTDSSLLLNQSITPQSKNVISLGVFLAASNQKKCLKQ